MAKRASLAEWLAWFYAEADFGPADGDVRYYMKKRFMKETGKEMPLGYDIEED